MKTAEFALNIKRLTLKAIVFTSLFLFSSFSLVYAQNLPTLGGVAVNVEISDTQVVEGDIISATKDGFRRSTEEYDVLVFGVVVNAPIISVEPKSETSRSVISSGETRVRVSAKNGEIAEGDLITTSTEAGVGQKATKNGYVIGKALEGFSDSGTALISVLVGPSFGSGSAAGSGGVGSLVGIIGSGENPRILIAALLGVVVLLGLIFAFIRLISTGVAAVGRNPLARGTIYRSMIIAGIVIAILAIAGAAGVIAIITTGT